MRRARKIVPQDPAVKELIALYTESLTSVTASKIDVSRLMNVRCSALPFCPISFFGTHANNGRTRFLDMVGSFYTSIGTAVHATVQTHLAPSGRFLADWHCRQCGTWHRLSMKHECCDFQCDYHEVEVAYKGVCGHIDGIFLDSAGNYWIVDYKTTSLASAKKKLKKPGVGYTEQVEAYALLMWLQYRIRVKGVMLFFIKRDNPREPIVYSKPFTNLKMQTVKTRLAGYVKAHKQALAVTTLKEALALLDYGRCPNPWCKFCTKTNTKALITEAYRRGSSRGLLPLSRLGTEKKRRAVNSD